MCLPSRALSAFLLVIEILTSGLLQLVETLVVSLLQSLGDVAFELLYLATCLVQLVHLLLGERRLTNGAALGVERRVLRSNLLDLGFQVLELLHAGDEEAGAACYLILSQFVGN